MSNDVDFFLFRDPVFMCGAVQFDIILINMKSKSTIKKSRQRGNEMCLQYNHIIKNVCKMTHPMTLPQNLAMTGYTKNIQSIF